MASLTSDKLANYSDESGRPKPADFKNSELNKKDSHGNSVARGVQVKQLRVMRKRLWLLQ